MLVRNYSYLSNIITGLNQIMKEIKRRNLKHKYLK